MTIYKIPCSGCGKQLIVNNLYTWYCNECIQEKNKKINREVYYKKIGEIKNVR